MKPIESIIKLLITIGVIAIIIIVLSSCKILTGKKSTIESSADVSKSKQGTSKTDSTGNKKEYTKETFIFPGRDTIINNFIQTPGINIPAPTVYIRETGKEQSSEVHKDESWREAFDSLMSAMTKTQTKTEVKVGPDTLQIIIICALILIILRMFGPAVIKILSPIK